jgi:hypothetical protein
MNTLDPVHTFARFKREDKIRFLCRLAFELTIVARDTYIPQTEDLSRPAHLRAINELQHQILSYLSALTSGDRALYPDNALIAVILEAGKDVIQRSQVHDAFERALASVLIDDA